MALRDEGSDDLADLLPETQYGIALVYGLLETLEYLHGAFEIDDQRDLLTTQLAIEF